MVPGFCRLLTIPPLKATNCRALVILSVPLRQANKPITSSSWSQHLVWQSKDSYRVYMPYLPRPDVNPAPTGEERPDAGTEGCMGTMHTEPIVRTERLSTVAGSSVWHHPYWQGEHSGRPSSAASLVGVYTCGAGAYGVHGWW